MYCPESRQTTQVAGVFAVLVRIAKFDQFHCARSCHTLKNLNTIATIFQADVRQTTRTGSVQHDGHHSPQPTACSFSRSRGSRVRRVPVRPACQETGREPPDLRRRRIRAFDPIRQRPDTLTRITRPPIRTTRQGLGNTGSPPAFDQYSHSSHRQASAGWEARGRSVSVRLDTGANGLRPR